MTIMEALQWANNKLKKTGIDSPMLDAEILLAHSLDVPKTWLFSHFADKLKTHQRERFQTLIDKRMNREPVAYLVGKKAFYGRDFNVDKNVLIPRPETETLIETVLEQIKEKDKDHTLIADIGTGSGAIAITLSAETHIPVVASDIDENVLEVAKKNAKKLVPEESIDFQQGNLAEPIVRLFKTIRGQSDVQTSSVYPFKTLLITANLPYLSESRMDNLQEDVRHEPELALRAGIDGLDAYWELFRQLRTHRHILPRETIVLIEIDPEQKSGAQKLIEHSFPMAELETKKDLHGDNRILIAQI